MKNELYICQAIKISIKGNEFITRGVTFRDKF
jgi:hypothetical protein